MRLVRAFELSSVSKILRVFQITHVQNLGAIGLETAKIWKIYMICWPLECQNLAKLNPRHLKIGPGVSDNLCTKFEHNLTKNNKVTALTNF